ncbi:MAG: ATP-binding protein [Spirochaetia bacterium]|nr:ATP-binding protein [Spirochaetia bacterium]
MNKSRYLPIGIQTFEELRTKNYIYVDKTAFVDSLVRSGKPYFLSRPRRFGKSLFLSTLRSYFEGRKDLFEGLAISKTETEWKKYPVFYFDFNVGDFTTEENFRASLGLKLDSYEKIYGVRNPNAKSPADRFSDLLKSAHEKTGLQAVVLVDEYDKPLLNAIDDQNLVDAFRKILKTFYGVLKGEDAHIQFVFITGVTRFDKVSIFSDLNNLNDISLSEKYSYICGISQEELESNFVPEIELMAEKNGYSKEECLAELKKNYDGYHFSKDVQTDIYNPFSLLKAFSDLSFGSYWFSTGTPTFLTKMMLDMSFDYKTLEEGIDVDSRSLEEYRLNSTEPVPLLYQTGYLTIKNYEKDFDSYTIGVPNEEVKFGMYKRLLPLYLGYPTDDKKIEIVSFLKELRAGKVNEFMERINNIFAAAPKQTNQKQYELNCQAFVWLIFKLMGEFVLCEVQNGKGRSDAVVWQKDAIYIFEFKMDGLAKEALEQINSQNYPIAYKNDGRKIVKVGVNYSSTEKQLTEWMIE